MGETKSQVVAPIVWVAPATVGRPQEPRNVVPGAVKDHAPVTEMMQYVLDTEGAILVCPPCAKVRGYEPDT